jgi:hypothetical protein
MLCAMALKSSNSRQTHHTLSGLRVCCERGLKSADERNTHGGGAVRGPPGNRLHGGLWELAHLAYSGDLAAGGFPCWQIADRVVGRAASPLAARCAHDVLAGHNLNIIYYITLGAN